MSIMTVFQIAQLTNNFFAGVTHSFTLPYFALSVSLNLLLSLMIAGRLLAMRAQMRAALGREHTRLYTSVSAVIIEAAAIYAATSIWFIATFSLGSPLLEVVLPLHFQVMVRSSTPLCLRTR